ncbi:hypothetical protein [Evansella clarkii]|uniref:hypothetical protein n=1 Tax=Evansella clarkii TaxID=79879 RepID=UPI000B453609|nr:hypothetical protein [Evansella clarkii]
MLSKRKVGVSLWYFAKEVKAVRVSANLSERDDHSLFLTQANAEDLAGAALDFDANTTSLGRWMVDGDPEMPELTLSYLFFEYMPISLPEFDEPFKYIKGLQSHAKHYRKQIESLSVESAVKERLQLLVDGITVIDKLCRGVRVSDKLLSQYNEFDRALLSELDDWQVEAWKNEGAVVNG